MVDRVGRKRPRRFLSASGVFQHLWGVGVAIVCGSRRKYAGRVSLFPLFLDGNISHKKAPHDETIVERLSIELQGGGAAMCRSSTLGCGNLAVEKSAWVDDLRLTLKKGAKLLQWITLESQWNAATSYSSWTAICKDELPSAKCLLCTPRLWDKQECPFSKEILNWIGIFQ